MTTDSNNTAVVSDDTFTVADMARDLGIDPKTARARLRRAYLADDARELPEQLETGKWEFNVADTDVIAAIISD